MTGRQLHPAILFTGYICLFIIAAPVTRSLLQIPLLYSAGILVITLIYLISLLYIGYDRQPHLEHLQTGEVSLIILSSCICMRLTGPDIVPIIASSFFATLLSDLFVKYVLVPSKKEFFMTGMALHLVTGLVLLLLHTKDYFFSIEYVQKAASGFLLYSQPAPETIISLSLFLVISASVSFIFHHQFRLHSFGIKTSQFTSGRYLLLDLLITFMRTATIVVTVVMIGTTGGIGLYLLNLSQKTFIKIMIVIFVGIYFFILSIYTKYTVWYIIPVVSVSVSYTVFFIHAYITNNLYKQ